MRKSYLKHICDSISWPSAMRNQQHRGHVSRRHDAWLIRSAPGLHCCPPPRLQHWFFIKKMHQSTARAQLPAPLGINVVVWCFGPACMQRRLCKQQRGCGGGSSAIRKRTTTGFSWTFAVVSFHLTWTKAFFSFCLGKFEWKTWPRFFSHWKADCCLGCRSNPVPYECR